jgi:hypothetical protein
MADMMVIDATKKSLSNRQACIVIPLLVVPPMMLGKVAGTHYMKMALPSTLRTMRLDTIIAIEANISKYPCL